MSGSGNTAVGVGAGEGITGEENVALGHVAGTGVHDASNVICIGVAGENLSNSCYIGQIFGAISLAGVSVSVNANGKLGTTPSSRRFKADIEPMDKASEALLALQPVVFRYKKDIDPAATPQLGLVAEDVEKVNPALVVRDKEGKPYSVRYDQVNPMLLNEFLKAHRKLQEQETKIVLLNSTDAKQEATIAKLQKQIEALSAGLQKVSTQLEASKSGPQVVNNL